MKEIDLNHWPRTKHFKLYHGFDYPHFNLSASVDVTHLQPAIKERGLSSTITITYLLARVANEIPEFRYRIRGNKVVEHDAVHPSTSILTPGDLFSFCTIEYSPEFDVFYKWASERVEEVRQNPTLEDEPGQDDLLFMSSIPWISFTQISHPIHMHPVDSVPRITWGKYFIEAGRMKLPLSVQVHHALMDGVHVGRFFIHTQEYLDDPDRFIFNGKEKTS
jgi:chloramphenicol O-acetyltransferase type A